MDRAHTSDKRPAIAFDNVQEVELMQIALRSYKGSESNLANKGFNAWDETDSLINRLESLLDELDKVKKMFNKK